MFLPKLNVPDVEAAEEGEQETRENWQGNGQKHCHYPVDPNPAHLEQGVAPDPHSVTTANRHWLSNYILKRHLWQEELGPCSITIYSMSLNMSDYRDDNNVIMFGNLEKHCWNILFIIIID